MAFLQKNGAVQVVDFSASSAVANGTLLLGKYQFIRARLLQLDRIILENIIATNNFVLTLLTALDGKNNVQSLPTLRYQNGLMRVYDTRAIGINHSLLLQGGFTMVGIELVFNIHGKR